LLGENTHTSHGCIKQGRNKKKHTKNNIKNNLKSQTNLSWEKKMNQKALILIAMLATASLASTVSLKNEHITHKVRFTVTFDGKDSS